MVAAGPTAGVMEKVANNSLARVVVARWHNDSFSSDKNIGGGREKLSGCRDALYDGSW